MKSYQIELFAVRSSRVAQVSSFMKTFKQNFDYFNYPINDPELKLLSKLDSFKRFLQHVCCSFQSLRFAFKLIHRIKEKFSMR